MPADRDLPRAAAVLGAAVLQMGTPVGQALLGRGSDQAEISNAFRSPITPAGYAFAIWGLIYTAALVLAAYQLRATQRTRTVHRRTGWWLVAAFCCSAAWVPIFSTRVIWLSQVVILALVGCLAVAALRFTATGPAPTWGERLAFRLPVMLYLGWAIPASAAGLGTTLRSLGLSERGTTTTVLGVIILLGATALALVLVLRAGAVVGLMASTTWALVAIAVGTYAGPVRVGALVAVGLIVVAVARRVSISRRPVAVLVG